jgi:hypothetical protein
MSSLNYTLQIVHIKSSLHSHTLATNYFLHSFPYRTELSWTLFSSESKSKSHSDWQPASQSVSLCVVPHVGLLTRYLLLFDSYGLVFVGALSGERMVCYLYLLLALANAVFLRSRSLGTLPLWWEDGFVICTCCWSLPEQSCLGQRPLGLATIYYCLKFETSIFITSCDSQGIWPCLHTGSLSVILEPLIILWHGSHRKLLLFL